MTKLRLLAPALLLAGAATVAAAGWRRDTAPPTDAARTRGPMPARVVSLTPSATENAFALGFGDRLVGVTSGCDYPPQARAIPRVGGATPDLESILALRPDLVIGDRTASGRHVERLRRMGVPVWASSGVTLEGVFADIESMGRALGDAERGQDLAAPLRARCGRVREALAGVPEEARPRVLFEYWPDPLWTAGRGTFVEEAVTLAGGRNAASAFREGWGTVQWEAVLSLDPDAFVLAHAGRGICERRAGWRSLRAVRAGRIFEIPQDLLVRPTPRLVEGIERLAHALHGDRF